MKNKIDRIITSELIMYESGFLEGKSDIVLQIIAGNITDEYQNLCFNDVWYSYGYNDAVDYYFNKYKTGSDTLDIILDTETPNLIEELFIKRVLTHNSSGQDKVAIGKFVRR